MFEVIIRDGFSSAHALRHYHGVTEPLHGHNFQVEVIVRGKRLQNKVKYLTDFIELKEALRDVLKPLDRVNLNEIQPFTNENPSAENLARHIAVEITGRWHESGATLASVTVWETPECAARYLP